MNTIQKVIILFRELTKPNGIEIEELSKMLGLSDNRVYKNIKQIEEAGFEVIKDKAGSRRIRKEQLLSFFNMTTEQLKKTDRIQEAIKAGKCIYLCEYMDSKGEVQDFKVEPMELFDQNRRLWAYHDSKPKQFKIARIGFLKDSATPAFLTPVPIKEDVFGTTGDCFTDVSFQMTALAYHLIKETYPESYQYISETGREDYPYLFEGSVTSFFGVGRYIMGVPGHINQIQPAKLLDHIVKESRKAYYI